MPEHARRAGARPPAAWRGRTRRPRPYRARAAAVRRTTAAGWSCRHRSVRGGARSRPSRRAAWHRRAPGSRRAPPPRRAGPPPVRGTAGRRRRRGGPWGAVTLAAQRSRTRRDGPAVTRRLDRRPIPSPSVFDQPQQPQQPPQQPQQPLRRVRASRWDRPQEPRDWRWLVGSIGRTLIAVGLLIFAFVAYQLWGTGIQTARAQASLSDEFDELLEDSTTLPPPATTPVGAPATTIVGTVPVERLPPTTAPDGAGAPSPAPTTSAPPDTSPRTAPDAAPSAVPASVPPAAIASATGGRGARPGGHPGDRGRRPDDRRRRLPRRAHQGAGALPRVGAPRAARQRGDRRAPHHLRRAVRGSRPCRARRRDHRHHPGWHVRVRRHGEGRGPADRLRTRGADVRPECPVAHAGDLRSAGDRDQAPRGARPPRRRPVGARHRADPAGGARAVRAPRRTARRRPGDRGVDPSGDRLRRVRRLRRLRRVRSDRRSRTRVDRIVQRRRRARPARAQPRSLRPPRSPTAARTRSAAAGSRTLAHSPRSRCGDWP